MQEALALGLRQWGLSPNSDIYCEAALDKPLNTSELPLLFYKIKTIESTRTTYFGDYNLCEVCVCVSPKSNGSVLANSVFLVTLYKICTTNNENSLYLPTT